MIYLIEHIKYDHCVLTSLILDSIIFHVLKKNIYILFSTISVEHYFKCHCIQLNI